jgi:phosphoribosylaminoimidazole-succinocarboxamide synthase
MEPFLDIDLSLADRRDGKVRVSYALAPVDGEDRRLFVTTDRLSAFDRVIAGVPYKGQVLNQLAAWWFANTADIVPNHVLSVPDPNVLIARAASPLPVEVVVRGYITGVTSTSLWQQYADGAREIYGHRFPDGLRKNTVLSNALVTPTTKGSIGGGDSNDDSNDNGTGNVHDVPLTVAEVAQRGLVATRLWGQVVETALALFQRGQQQAATAGLILADTKYEFGTAADGSLLLIDEMHTPDSSRYWVADSYDERLAAGEEPESLDKEVVRRALLAAGYRGDGEPPVLPADVWTETTRRYIQAYERLTGSTFEPGAYPVQPRIMENLRDVS